jgi:zinc transport system substrate-binding protein
VTNICEELVTLDPEHADVFGENLAGLRAELKALDRELAETLAPLRGERIYVFHPAFGYFADAYGLIQVAVESGGGEPGPRELAALIEAASGEGVRAIFVQPQHSRRSAEVLATEIGAAVVPADPLAEDYLENLRAIAEEVVSQLEVTDREPGEN